MKGVRWTTQDIIEKLFPFVKAAQNLEELIIFDDKTPSYDVTTLFSPELISSVFSTDNYEKVISSLYSKRRAIWILYKPEWMQ